MPRGTGVNPPRTLRDLSIRLRPGGTKRRLVEYIMSKPVPGVFTSQELEQVSGGTIQWQRRWRELRDAGLELHSDKDRGDLEPGQYLVVSHGLNPHPSRAHRQIPASLRQQVLTKMPYCGLCGRVAGDPHPTRPGRAARLEVDHRDPDGPTEESNLWTLCDMCNHDRANMVPVDRDWITGQPVLAQLRTAPRWVKQKAMDYLLEYFGVTAKERAPTGNEGV